MILGFDLAQLLDMLKSVGVAAGSMTGMALVVMMIVNVLKYTGIVKDGTSQTWVAVFNAAAVAILFVLKVLKFNVDYVQVDTAITVIYNASIILINFFWANFASKFGYSVVKNVPVIGKSMSTEA